MKTGKIRTGLSLIWLIFTMSLVTWWFIFAIQNLNLIEHTEQGRVYKMLFYEGSTLLITVFLGGVVLIALSYKDDQRHKKLQVFFANFTHEIKTSITRIRLQSDILKEKEVIKNNKILQRLLNDISKLDLQLENSLLIAHQDESKLLEEQLNVKELINSIQLEFEEIKIEISGNAEVIADSRALKSIFKNLFENSRRHGKAKKVFCTFESFQENYVCIHVQDDGIGTNHSANLLGNEILSTSQNQGSGIGLYLSKQLISKMNGEIYFKTNPDKKCFITTINLKGRLI